MIKPVEGNDLSTLTASELARVVTQDETDEQNGDVVTKHYVCSDADYAKEIAYLKSKVDAGADLVITQVGACLLPLIHPQHARPLVRSALWLTRLSKVSSSALGRCAAANSSA